MEEEVLNLNQSDNNKDKLNDCEDYCSIESNEGDSIHSGESLLKTFTFQPKQDSVEMQKCMQFWQKVLEKNLKPVKCTLISNKKAKKAPEPPPEKTSDVDKWLEALNEIKLHKLDEIPTVKPKQKNCCEILSRDYLDPVIRNKSDERREIIELNTWEPRSSPIRVSQSKQQKPSKIVSISESMKSKSIKELNVDKVLEASEELVASINPSLSPKITEELNIKKSEEIDIEKTEEFIEEASEIIKEIDLISKSTIEDSTSISIQETEDKVCQCGCKFAVCICTDYDLNVEGCNCGCNIDDCACELYNKSICKCGCELAECVCHIDNERKCSDESLEGKTPFISQDNVTISVNNELCICGCGLEDCICDQPLAKCDCGIECICKNCSFKSSSVSECIGEETVVVKAEEQSENIWRLIDANMAGNVYCTICGYFDCYCIKK